MSSVLFPTRPMLAPGHFRILIFRELDEGGLFYRVEMIPQGGYLRAESQMGTIEQIVDRALALQSQGLILDETIHVVRSAK